MELRKSVMAFCVDVVSRTRRGAVLVWTAGMSTLVSLFMDSDGQR